MKQKMLITICLILTLIITLSACAGKNIGTGSGVSTESTSADENSTSGSEPYETEDIMTDPKPSGNGMQSEDRVNTPSNENQSNAPSNTPNQHTQSNSGQGSHTSSQKSGQNNSTQNGKATPTQPQTVSPTGVSLNITAKTLDIGRTVQLTATVSPGNASDKSISWGSSNSAIVSVDKSGKATAKAMGTVKVTAKTVNGKTASCTVTVNDEMPVFNIDDWVDFAIAEGKRLGLIHDKSTTGSWDTPIIAGPNSKYLERDIKDYLNEYVRLGKTYFHVWKEKRSDGKYNLFIGYA